MTPDAGRRAAPDTDLATDRDRSLIDGAIAAAKRGDNDGFRFIYATYADDVYRFVRSIIGDEHEAEDVTQAVFLKLMRVIHKYEPEAVPFAAWLMRVARNAAIDSMRARRSIPCEEVRGEGSADAVDENRRRLSELADALASVGEEQRQVLLLRHLCGLAPGEVAVRLGKSEGSIHGLHHRGRRAVQAQLRERGVAPNTR
jgi:RNA polymerase sigma-70 factor (ECF subfamily)